MMGSHIIISEPLLQDFLFSKVKLFIMKIISILMFYRDLTSWINSMMTLVSSDELAKDVTGAEALLERHQVNHLSFCLDVLLLLLGFSSVTSTIVLKKNIIYCLKFQDYLWKVCAKN